MRRFCRVCVEEMVETVNGYVVTSVKYKNVKMFVNKWFCRLVVYVLLWRK